MAPLIFQFSLLIFLPTRLEVLPRSFQALPLFCISQLTVSNPFASTKEAGVECKSVIPCPVLFALFSLASLGSAFSSC